MKKRPQITEHRFDQWAEDLKAWIVESVSPFEADTPAKQRQRKARAQWDKLFFMATYLPHYFTVDFGDFHQEWGNLADLRDEVVLVAAPREHAKSTFFTFGDLLHDICFPVHHHFLLIISDTNDQATGFTLPLRLELEDNPRIKHDFGKLTGPVWAKNDFVTATEVRVLGRGRGEKVRGLKHRQWRPTKAVVDDFENDENVRNPKQVKQGKEYLQKAVLGSLGAGYTFIMVGNLFHPKSVLSQLMAETDEDGQALYVSRIYQAIVNEGKPGERPLWPALWSLERLKAKRRLMTTYAFNAEMMNRVGAEESPFQEAWFKFYRREELPRLDAAATFIDPSAKKGEANDFKGIISVGIDRANMRFYVLHAWLRHASPGEMFAQAYRQHDDYGGAVGIEENMLEDFLHEAIGNYAKEAGRYLPWVPIKHSTNKEARIIGTLAYLVEHGKMFFEKGHSDQDLLREQLVYILNRNVNDDGPDALEGAVKLLQTGSFGPVAYESLAKRRFAEMRGCW